MPSSESYIITELRLPRAVVAVLAGVAFGLSGAVFQTLMRNPLASPDFTATGSCSSGSR